MARAAPHTYSTTEDHRGRSLAADMDREAEDGERSRLGFSGRDSRAICPSGGDQQTLPEAWVFRFKPSPTVSENGRVREMRVQAESKKRPRHISRIARDATWSQRRQAHNLFRADGPPKRAFSSFYISPSRLACWVEVGNILTKVAALVHPSTKSSTDQWRTGRGGFVASSSLYLPCRIASPCRS